MIVEAPHVSGSIATRSKQVLNVSAAVIGNTLEWYDVLVYAYFVSFIAARFFPPSDTGASTLMAFAAFGLSYVVRPLGAVVFGWLADRSGRKLTMTVVSLLMFLGTGIIVVLPGYRSIGVAATALLLVARLLQGFSAGGEFGSATAYLSEQSASRRAYFSSLQFASQGGGMLLAALLGGVLTARLSEANMFSWGWRVPFIVGLMIGPVAFFIRYRVEESPEFLMAAGQRGESRRLSHPRDFFGRVLIGAGLVMVGTVSVYLLVYMPTYASTVLKLDRESGFATGGLAGLTLLVLTPLAGIVADRVGLRIIAYPVTVLLVLVPVPLFLNLATVRSALMVFIVQFSVAALIAAYFGTLPAMLSGLFATSARSTGIALCYNIAVVLGGGFAPVVFTLLIKWSGSAAAPGFYLSFAAGISLVALQVARRLRWIEH